MFTFLSAFILFLGLNVGLQGLATNLSGIQNVQVSIPGFPVPISLALSVPASAGQSNTSSAIIVSSPSTLNVSLYFYVDIFMRKFRIFANR